MHLHSVSHEALNITETLSSLAYLIGLDAEDPSLVRSYADEAETQLTTLARLLRSITVESETT